MTTYTTPLARREAPELTRLRFWSRILQSEMNLLVLFIALFRSLQAWQLRTRRTLSWVQRQLSTEESIPIVGSSSVMPSRMTFPQKRILALIPAHSYVQPASANGEVASIARTEKTTMAKTVAKDGEERQKSMICSLLLCGKRLCFLVCGICSERKG
ncbi:MAG: hypothetical protein BYD32DRAFT_429112 [Podila humilis]|nr:MAG: hypothetical protein BYD32DRAFT_429112 [Podila humilis]